MLLEVEENKQTQFGQQL